MGKKPSASRRGSKTTGPSGAVEDIPVVSGREPCPCGSGRRYKACHGRAAGHAAETFVARPFQGLAGECDWVALREIVPAATAGLTLAGAAAGQSATLATVLPMAWPASGPAGRRGVRRPPGAGGSGDANRDVAHALERALAAEPGTPIETTALPGPGPRLQDLLDPAASLDVRVHAGFDFWLEGVEDRSPEVVASMERANEAAVPTVRLTSVEAAYWCQIRDRFHLRWVVPHDEDDVAGRAGSAACGRRRHVGGRVALRRLVPGARPRRPRLGPAGRDQRRVPGGARRRLRGAARRGHGGQHTAGRSRPPGPGRAYAAAS